MERDPREWGLVAAQTAAMAGLLGPGAPAWRLSRPARLLALAAVAAGSLLGVAGGAGLGRRISPFPAPHEAARLRTTGAYAVSRNPIYTGLVITAAGVAVLRRRPEPLVALGALVGILQAKVRYEERLLAERFGPSYSEYAARVPRLLPIRLPPARGRGSSPARRAAPVDR